MIDTRGEKEEERDRGYTAFAEAIIKSTSVPPYSEEDGRLIKTGPRLLNLLCGNCGGLLAIGKVPLKWQDVVSESKFVQGPDLEGEWKVGTKMTCSRCDMTVPSYRVIC